MHRNREPQVPQSAVEAHASDSTRPHCCRLASLAAPANPVLAQATIDQNKAAIKGIGGGDTAGFPITIAQPGSYKLMSNLVIGNPAVGAIHVTAPDVTIDLNSFSISGPNTCNPQTKTCTQPYGQSRGIFSEAPNTTVMNGSVGSFNFGGIALNSRGGVARHVYVQKTSSSAWLSLTAVSRAPRRSTTAAACRSTAG